MPMFEERIAPHLNSVERFLALLVCRFVWDANAPVLYIRLPRKDDEPIDGIKILRDMTFDEFLDVYNQAYAFPLANFGHECVVEELERGLVAIYKADFLEGNWKEFKSFFSCKDGTSIPKGGWK